LRLDEPLALRKSRFGVVRGSLVVVAEEITIFDAAPVRGAHFPGQRAVRDKRATRETIRTLTIIDRFTQAMKTRLRTHNLMVRMLQLAAKDSTNLTSLDK
jgi:hypothetical protein